MGLDPARMVPKGAAQGPQVFELWDECVDAFQVFRLCRRSWRVVAGLSGLVYLGLDLTAVETVMRRLGFSDERQLELLDQLQVMEDEGVKVLNA